MARIQAGDQSALGVLLDRYGRLVLGIGSRVLRDSGEAQELVQEVFLRVYNKCHLFDRSRGSVRAWLIQVASNTAFNRREYLNLRRFYEVRDLDDLIDVLKDGSDLEYTAEVQRSGRLLKGALQKLSEKQRMTLELYFFEGYTMREISERLNDSVENTRHHYYRGLERLRATVRTD